MSEKLKQVNNVTAFGKESQECVAEQFLLSEYFFYPLNQTETFCNCAAEAQLYNTVCIYNSGSGLDTTIGDRGLAIVERENYVENTCGSIMELMNDNIKKKDMVEMGHVWAYGLNQKNTRQKWRDLFKI